MLHEIGLLLLGFALGYGWKWLASRDEVYMAQQTFCGRMDCPHR